MAFAGASGNRDRLKSAAAVLLIHVAVGYAILNAFDIRPSEVVKSALSNLNVIDVPIPPIIANDKPKQATPEPEGAASAANLKKQARRVKRRSVS